MDKKSLKGIYGLYAPIYDFVFEPFFRSARYRAVEMLNPKKEESVLELGVGTGQLLECYPEWLDLTAIDISEEMLKKTKKRAREKEFTSVDLYPMDSADLDFEDNTFDKAIAAYFLSATPEPLKSLKEIERVTKDNSTAVFLNHFQSENKVLGFLEKCWSPLCEKLGFRTDLNLGELLEESTFEIDLKEKVNLLNYWTLVRCGKNKNERD